MHSASHNAQKKPHDMGDDKGDKNEKPAVKTLSRVPRACNACRKQKMRCEGADNPPCRRCRNTGLECMFERPNREATLTGEAGLERIRSLEAHVVEIRHSQSSILNSLAEIQAQLRGSVFPVRPPPPEFMASFHHHSPIMHSPAAQTPSTVHSHSADIQPSPTGAPPMFNRGPGANTPGASRSSRPPYPGAALPQQSQMPPAGEYTGPQPGPPNAFPPIAYTPGFQGPQGPVLPPFSSIQSMGQPTSPQQAQGNVSSVRFYPPDNGQPGQRTPHMGTKRPATSGESSELDDEDNGELPASGLVAPWEVLRGLADVAIERAAKENGDSSDAQSRPRTPISDSQARPTKRRKIRHKGTRVLTFPDVVTKNIISEAEARDLFRIFYHGCSTFLPVFDSTIDTFENLHQRSPFAVDAICMVASHVRDGGGKSSEIYLRCLDETQAISCATLFSPVARIEAVQSMILVSGWSDNGWLSGGHAVRMALELSLHKAWPKLLQRMNANKANATDDRDLVTASRTWFTLYLFEHQLSYGTGRPAILKEDDSIRHARALLQHPLAIEDDMRLVSTLELMAIREKLHNSLSPSEGQVRDSDFEEMRRADTAFRQWYATWDTAFSQKYEDAAFYRQSLQVQHLHAELFHNAVALRGINGPEDVENMPAVQRDLAIRSIQIAQQGVDITITSPAYKEGLKYAVHYTHATATFTASFLLRLARLFPNECDTQEIKHQVERLASLMADVPGKRYALTLQLMLKRFQSRRASSSSSRSPTIGREPHRQQLSMIMDHGGQNVAGGVSSYTSSSYSNLTGSPEGQQVVAAQVPGPVPYAPHPHQHQEAEQIWRGFESTANEQLPVWISDQSLGGQSFQQHGMDAFLLPSDYLPPGPQI
ncbi:hypothetical protein EDD85DRAFT_924755 [Armillaria nabsnona]|nr:hypothetical protein EDD85DRAFT_924755 [Armillaria nabsnona]